MIRSRVALILASLLITFASDAVRAADTLTPLGSISVSTTTADKPQSKLWFHAGSWWGVFPTTAVKPTGTWVWWLEPNHTWTAVRRLSAATDTRADAKQIDEVVHVIMDGASPQLASIEYDPGSDTYIPWTGRPTLTPVSLPGNETVTLDVDSTGRMWLSTESGSQARVLWADPPYAGPFSAPIVLDNHIAADDITMVTALPVMLLPDGNIGRSIGVFWSNQNTKLFGFRLHRDGTAPDAWLADESPAHQSALNVGGGLADDHMNFAVASDGTLYAAVKTSYNSTSAPLIALLVRRPNVLAPNNSWDDLYEVDRGGTRPCALLNEAAGTVQVVYTTASGGGNIVMKESSISNISFGSARRTLLTGNLNNVTSTKDNWTDQVVVLASGKAIMINHDLGVTTTTVTTTSTTTTSTTPPPTTTTSTAPGATTTTTSTTTTSTSTTLGTGSTTNTYQAGVSGPTGSANVDANIRLSTLTTNYGTDPNLYVGVTNGPDKIYRTFMAFNVSNIPAGAVITSCRLTVNVTQRTNPTGGHVRRLCGEHWLDGDAEGENQVTWNSWKTGAAWGVAGAASTAACNAGGDYTTTDEVAYIPPTGTGPFTFPDLTALCQEALNQQGGWLRLRVSQDSEATQGNLFKVDSSDATTVSNRPKLVVMWH